MNLVDIKMLFAYNEWANARVLLSIKALRQDEFLKPIPSSFSSIRDTLSHIVLVEWAWLLRWKGESPSSPPQWAGAQDCESLAARLSEVQADRASFFASLKESDLDRFVTYKNIKGEQSQSVLADLLLHLVNHSTYHRGQLTTLLRQLGSTPLATDLLLFRREVSS